jgi:hypothetical protein
MKKMEMINDEQKNIENDIKQPSVFIHIPNDPSSSETPALSPSPSNSFSPNLSSNSSVSIVSFTSSLLTPNPNSLPTLENISLLIRKGDLIMVGFYFFFFLIKTKFLYNNWKCWMWKIIIIISNSRRY